jgi:hypothetical protein
MQKRSSKYRLVKDPNQIAIMVVEEVTKRKNPAAVELGRLGGLKGGKARAEKLSSERRSEIARKAALARWGRMIHISNREV